MKTIIFFILLFWSINSYAEDTTFKDYQEKTGIFLRDGHFVSPCRDLENIFMNTCTERTENALLGAYFNLEDRKKYLKKQANLPLIKKMSQLMNNKYEKDWGLENGRKKEKGRSKKTPLRVHTTPLCIAIKQDIGSTCDYLVGYKMIELLNQKFIDHKFEMEKKAAKNKKIEAKKANTLRSMEFTSKCQEEALEATNKKLTYFSLLACKDRKEEEYQKGEK